MAEKHDLVSYLTGINSLLEAQDNAGTNLRSATLAKEFNLGFVRLKEILTGEHDEARKRNEEQSRKESDDSKQDLSLSSRANGGSD